MSETNSVPIQTLQEKLLALNGKFSEEYPTKNKSTPPTKRRRAATNRAAKNYRDSELQQKSTCQLRGRPTFQLLVRSPG